MPILMIISIAIYAIVMRNAIRNFKKTVIIWNAISVLFNAQVCVIYSPAISLTVFTNLSLILLYFTRFKNDRKQYNNEVFALKPFVCITLFSIFVSTLFSVIPFIASFNVIVKTSLMNFCMIFIIFKVINDKSDIILFVKSYIVVALIITINAIIENFTSINIVGDFIYMTSPHTDDLHGRSFYTPAFIRGAQKMRFGLARCYSTFNIHIAFGVACLFIFYLLTIVQRTKIKLYKMKGFLGKNILQICIILLIIGIILSNSKAPLLGFAVLILGFYKLKDIFSFKVLIPLIACVIFISYFAPNFFNLFLSITDEDLAEEGGGSSIALREIQFESIIKLFNQNPIIGNGINAAMYYSKNINGFEMILGAESIWFRLLADQGILGCISYLASFYYIHRFCHNIIPYQIYIPCLLSVFIIESVTGTVNILIWLPILIVIRRVYQLGIK